MKTQIICISLLFISIISCQSQDILRKDKSKQEPMPQEKLVVNKTYDKEGNLVAMDSIYTYFYSNVEGDSLIDDSIINNFGMYFNDEFSGLAQNHFLDMDSVFISDFYHHDYFEQSFLKQDEEMLKLMRLMDSIKNNYFQQIKPQGYSDN